MATAPVLRRVAVGAAGLALVWASTPLREALVALEPAIVALLFSGAVLGTVLRWLSRRGRDVVSRRSARRAERALGAWLDAWGWALAILLFLLPLLSHWALRPPGRATAVAALLGRVPWSDAHGHFEGANRLLAEGKTNGFSERRPMAAAWLSVELALVRGRLAGALVLQCALAGLAAFLAARAVAWRFGVFAGLAFFGLQLGLVRDTLPAVLTEPLGATLACLAVAVLATDRARASLGVLALGFILLDSALRARPGAQLLLPCLGAWAVCAAPGRRLRTAAVLVGVLAVGALHTAGLNALHGSGEASATSYPAFTLYGLTRDANYEAAYRDFGDELRRRPEAEVAPLVYRKALERLAADPTDFLRALGRNGAEALRKLPSNLARALSPRALVAPHRRLIEPTAADTRIDRVAGGLLLLAAGLGLLIRLRRAPREETLFWIAAALGLAGSASLVLADSAVRVLAAGFPLIAFALGSGLGSRRLPGPAGPRRAREGRAVRVAGGRGLGILLVSSAGPSLARRLEARPPESALRALRPGPTAVIRPAACPAVVVSDREREGGRVPALERRQLVRLLAIAPPSDPADLASLRPPFALLSCYDHLANRQRVLVSTPELALGAWGFVRLDLRPLVEGSQFFEVSGFSAVE